MAEVIGPVVKQLLYYLAIEVAKEIASYIYDKLVQVANWFMKTVSEIFNFRKAANEHDKKVIDRSVATACDKFKDSMKEEVTGKLQDKNLERKILEHVDTTVTNVMATAA